MPFQPGPLHPNYKGSHRRARRADGKTLSDLFRDYTESAVRLLAAVMNDKQEKTQYRVQAAQIILQRGWGDAPKALQVTAISDTSRVIELTEQELIDIAASRLQITKQDQEVIDVQPTDPSPPPEIDPPPR